MRPVCVNCRCEMRCVKNGFYVVHGYDDSAPHKIKGGVKQEGDAYLCNICGSCIVVGFGKELLIRDHPILSQDSVISLDESFLPQNIPPKKP